jgi:hypothetical protein
MAYDEGLAQRVEETLGDSDFVAKKMFGGVAYLLNGNMAVGISNESLMVRVGKENYETAIAEDHVGEFDLSGKSMAGWVMVAPQGIAEDDDLSRWIDTGVGFALSLPPK